MSSAVDWSSLPPELLQATATYLPTIIDYIYFRAVCRSWCAAAQMKCRFLPREFPCLMVPADHSPTRRRLFNPVTEKSFHGASLSKFSEIQRCIGSSFGRLILADGSPNGMIVVNPLTGAKAHLPALLSFPGVRNFDSSRSEEEYTIQRPDGVFIWVGLDFVRNLVFQKVILTHDCEDNHHPIPNEPFAVALSHLKFNVAYCKHGDQSWRTIEGTGRYNRDAIYLKGKLYLVNCYGSLAICDLNNDPPTVEFITVEEPSDRKGILLYLVDAMDELLLVQRSIDSTFSKGFQTLKFTVFKFDWSIKKWKQIKSLGNKALFLGCNTSVALAVRDSTTKCKENAIYFTGDYSFDFDERRECFEVGDLDEFREAECYEVSMYDMTSQSIEVLASYPRSLFGLVWVTPFLHV